MVLGIRGKKCHKPFVLCEASTESVPIWSHVIPSDLKKKLEKQPYLCRVINSPEYNGKYLSGPSIVLSLLNLGQGGQQTCWYQTQNLVHSIHHLSALGVKEH